MRTEFWFGQEFKSEWKQDEITELQYKEIQKMQCILGNEMFFYFYQSKQFLTREQRQTGGEASRLFTII